MNITYAQWAMGRDVKYPPSQVIRDNANELLRRVNKLLTMYNVATDEVVTRVASGYRPPAINAATQGAAVKSNHLIGCALDLVDDDGSIDDWLESPEGQQALAECELWHENKLKTPRWAHVQSRPFGSYRVGGSRTFMP
jgi:hypothetical protein